MFKCLLVRNKKRQVRQEIKRRMNIRNSIITQLNKFYPPSAFKNLNVNIFKIIIKLILQYQLYYVADKFVFHHERSRGWGCSIIKGHWDWVMLNFEVVILIDISVWFYTAYCMLDFENRKLTKFNWNCPLVSEILMFNYRYCLISRVEMFVQGTVRFTQHLL